jgi:hypothetical protein
MLQGTSGGFSAILHLLVARRFASAPVKIIMATSCDTSETASHCTPHRILVFVSQGQALNAVCVLLTGLILAGKGFKEKPVVLNTPQLLIR